MKPTAQLEQLIRSGLATTDDFAGHDAEFIFGVKRDQDHRQRRFHVAPTLVRKADDESRTISFIASTEDVDRMGDVILVRGWDLKHYKKNPVALFQHNADWPIGTAKVTKGEVAGGKKALLSDITFASADASPMAEQTYQLVKEGVLRGNSVGFIGRSARAPKDDDEREKLGMGQWGLIFEKSELLEDSVVSVPANPAAVKRGLTDLVQRGTLTQAQADVFAKDAMGAEPAEWFAGMRRGFVALEGVGTQLADIRASIEAEERDALVPLGERRTPVDMGDRRDVVAPETRDFDVANQHIEAAKLEYDWVSRFCGCEVKQLHNVTSECGMLDAASVLTGLERAIEGSALHDTRAITDDGREVPPSYEQLQLDGERSGDFLSRGIRFMHMADGTPVAVKTVRRWASYKLSVYSRIDDAEKASDILSRAHAWAEKHHFRRGAAFTLNGDFLERGGTTSDDVFLTAENRGVVNAALEQINSRGADAANRGMIWKGPPGTGKTVTGRVFRDNAKATLIWCSSRDFMYSGVHGGLMRAFDMARRFAPAVILLEDIDGWIDRYAVDLLKTEMDGLESGRGVTTILTTNHPEHLPKALIDRPGRFHDVLSFDLPDLETRAAMFSRWYPGMGPAEHKAACDRSDEMSGAHIYELCAFAKQLGEMESLGTNAAMARAFEKLERQRELLGEHQRSALQLETRGAFSVPGASERRPRPSKQPDQSKEVADALRDLTQTNTLCAKAQVEQIHATRQLVDVLNDLARKVLELNERDTPSHACSAAAGPGDEEIDETTLRSLARRLKGLGDVAEQLLAS